MMDDIVNKEFTGKEAKDVENTALNNTTARETPSHISAENSTKKYEPKGGKIGPKGFRPTK